MTEDIARQSFAPIGTKELLYLAKLGQAAIKAIDAIDTDFSNQICDEPIFDNSRSCQSCTWQEFCRLRAEVSDK